MPRKRRSPKRRSSRPTKPKPVSDQRAEGGRSFGSGLDEIGFRPIGRRIPVSKQSSKGRQSKDPDETKGIASETTGHPASYSDDPLGYDTSDPSWVRKAVEDALSGADKDAIEKEVDAALRRWKLR